MIELPEAVSLAKQVTKALKGKKIKSVIAAYSPHKFAWYAGDPANYSALLKGKTIGAAESRGGQVEIIAENMRLLFTDGVNLRFHDKTEKRPLKHQLLLEFEDGTALSGSVQTYGGLSCFKDGTYDNPYYLVAKEKPSPLTAEFDQSYFNQIINAPDFQKMSAKALLAEQGYRDWAAGIAGHPFNAGIHLKARSNGSMTTQKTACCG